MLYNNHIKKAEASPRGNENERYRPLRRWIRNGALAVTLVAIVIYVGNFGQSSISAETQDWGAFGDYLGGILGAAISFAALSALLVTIELQAKTLDYTKAELDETRRELRAQRNQQEVFSLIQLLKAACITFRDSSDRSSVAKHISEALSGEGTKDQLTKIVRDQTSISQSNLATVYGLLRFSLNAIDEAESGESEKSRLAALILSIMEPEDALILSAIRASGLMEPRFEKLLEKYGMPVLHWSHRDLIVNVEWWPSYVESPLSYLSKP